MSDSDEVLVNGKAGHQAEITYKDKLSFVIKICPKSFRTRLALDKEEF